MLRFRPKIGSEGSSEWRCCFCLHVRTGTILLGSWHLMLHLIALVFLAAIVRDPRLVSQLEHDGAGDSWATDPLNHSTVVYPSETPTNRYQYGAQPRDHSLVYICTLAITLMLIYGAARGKPAHLLPFFCLQIFDFAITVLTATGYLCYLRSVKSLVSETRHVPWASELMKLPPPALALLVLAVFMLAVLLKGYCISVVWRCYKYLTMRAHTLHSLTPFVISRGGAEMPPPEQLAPPPPPPDFSSLLPAYEEVVKQSPPPSYRAATLMATKPVEPQPEVAPPPAPPSDTVVVLPQLGHQSRV